MSESTLSTVKRKSTSAPLSWITVCIWATALLAIHYYMLIRYDVMSQSYPVIVPALMYVAIVAIFYLAALLFSFVLMRRLPRAKGLLVSLSLFYALNLIVTAGGPINNRHPPIQTENTGVVAQPTKARLVNHEAVGNLESNHTVGCISISSARNVFTPSDIYEGVAECLAKDDMESGVRLNALARAYGFYDTLRVSDGTSHQALLILQMQAFKGISTAGKKRFSETAKRIFHDDVQTAEFCTEIRRLGPPSYDPTYMIQHGIGAFKNDVTNTPIVEGFDKESSWEKTLTTVLNCPTKATSERLTKQSS